MDNKFQWTDELVAQYSLQSQPLSIPEFKKLKIKTLVPNTWEILSFKYDDGSICNESNIHFSAVVNYYLMGFKDSMFIFNK